jgi:hypothetical protein
LFIIDQNCVICTLCKCIVKMENSEIDLRT